MNYKRITLFVMNILTMIVSYLIAYLMRFGTDWKNMFNEGSDYTVAAFLFASFLLVFLFYPVQTPAKGRGKLHRLKEAFLFNAFLLMIFATGLYLAHIGTNASRLLYYYFFCVNFVLTYLCLEFLHRAEQDYIASHKENTVVFANSDNVLEILRKIVTMGKQYDVTGIAIFDRGTYRFERISRNDAGHTYIPTDDTDMMTFLTREVVDNAFISLPDSRRSDIREIISTLDEMGIHSFLMLDSFVVNNTDSRVEMLGDQQVIRFAPRIFKESELFAKRCLDIVGGLVGCILCILIGLFVAPAIYLDDPGPIIFAQKRIGRNGRPFKMYKFRSMYTDAEARKAELMKDNEMNGLMFKMKDDPRITKVGKFIRKTSIDELPQFFNVLGGSMSLVGTRPPTAGEYAQYSPHHKRRLSLKPGITGMWQVSGRSDITDFEEVVRLDLKYIDGWSFLLDIKILIMTVASVVTGKGSE